MEKVLIIIQPGLSLGIDVDECSASFELVVTNYNQKVEPQLV